MQFSRVIYRSHPSEDWLERLAVRARCLVVHRLSARRRQWARLVERVGGEGRTLDGGPDAGILAAALDLRTRLPREGFTDALVARAFALVREVAGRTLGLRHYDVQLI